jgi:response regulator RpfG family c-di-GMP phosphodiesterase
MRGNPLRESACGSRRNRRGALSWEQATDEILAHGGSQFDPKVVRAFCMRERQLHRMYEELSIVAA